MSLDIDHNYVNGLRDAKPTYLKSKTIHPPPGALGDISFIPNQIIPPINTDIQFDILPKFKLSEHPGLSALDETTLPDQFNWRDNGGDKTSLLTSPGNQMLCGSCWAISTAGIVADNHVISGTVNWKPNLSTTWSLACYPQMKCQGGNSAILFQDIAKHGIATNSCVDYSWCAENEYCNTEIASKHFDKQQVNLSDYIPNCGCYDSKVDHYLYSIEEPKTLSISDEMSQEELSRIVKLQIYHYGPVQGGFLVFNNFMSGAFTKVNGGVYLENGIYDQGQVHFQDGYANGNTYVGSHAVAVIGWGVEKGVVIDNNGTKKDIPYWFCRNSWTPNWGDKGYFKMAMYPYNKLSQFDKVVIINSPKGLFKSGGMVITQAKGPPKLLTLPQIQEKFEQAKKIHPDSYYSTENKEGILKGDINKDDTTKPKKNNLKLYFIIGGSILGFLLLIFFIFASYKKRHAIKYIIKRRIGRFLVESQDD